MSKFKLKTGQRVLAYIEEDFYLGIISKESSSVVEVTCDDGDGVEFDLKEAKDCLTAISIVTPFDVDVVDPEDFEEVEPFHKDYACTKRMVPADTEYNLNDHGEAAFTCVYMYLRDYLFIGENMLTRDLIEDEKSTGVKGKRCTDIRTTRRISLGGFMYQTYSACNPRYRSGMPDATHGQSWGYDFRFDIALVCFKHFIEVVAHEMAHQWQWERFDTKLIKDHGVEYQSLSPLMSKFGLPASLLNATSKQCTRGQVAVMYDGAAKYKEYKAATTEEEGTPVKDAIEEFSSFEMFTPFRESAVFISKDEKTNELLFKFMPPTTAAHLTAIVDKNMVIFGILPPKAVRHLLMAMHELGTTIEEFEGLALQARSTHGQKMKFRKGFISKALKLASYSTH